MPAPLRDRGTPGPSVAGLGLTVRGWVFLGASAVVFLAAYTGGRAELLYPATLLGALPVIAIILVRMGRPRISATRSFSPDVVTAGESATVRLTVRNLGGRPTASAVWSDALPWHPGGTVPMALPELSPRGARFARTNSATITYRVLPPRRGVFQLGPLTVENSDPFGLAHASTSIGDAQELLVLPQVVHLAETALSLPAGDGEARLVQRRATGDDDDSMTREYRVGDAMRRVHWRASARRGDLMVRQEEQRSFPEARVLIDTRMAGYRDVADRGLLGELADEPQSETFEWVVRMAASVTLHLRRAGYLVSVEESCVVAGGSGQLEVVERGRRRGSGEQQFLTALAELQLVWRGSADDPARSLGSGPVITIAGDPDDETLGWMLAQRRPGELAVAFLARPLSAWETITRVISAADKTWAADRTWATDPAWGADDVGHDEHAQDARGSAADRLASAGWLVVRLAADEDPAVAWNAVVAESGRARVGG